MFCGLMVSEIVEQDGAQNRALGFDVRRQAVRETVISGGQASLFRGSLGREANAILPTKCLWMRSKLFGKDSRKYFFSDARVRQGVTESLCGV
jgi:hypothetical protein